MKLAYICVWTGGGRIGCVNRCCYVNFLCSAVVYATAWNNLCDYVILLDFICSLSTSPNVLSVYLHFLYKEAGCLQRRSSFGHIHTMASCHSTTSSPMYAHTHMHTNRNVTLWTATTTTRLLIESCVHLLTGGVCWKKECHPLCSFHHHLGVD